MVRDDEFAVSGAAVVSQVHLFRVSVQVSRLRVRGTYASAFHHDFVIGAHTTCIDAFQAGSAAIAL